MNTKLISAFVLALAFSASSQAALVVDQNQPSENTNMAGFSQPDLAQSFQQSAGNVAGAGIKLRDLNVDASDTVTIALWDSLPNEGGSLLAQGSLFASEGEWVDVFWIPVSVIPDTTLFLVFTGVNNSLAIAGDTSNPYDRGQTYANAGFGAFPNFDYTFRTYTDTDIGVGVVPVPAAVWLFGTALVGLIGFSKRRKKA